MNLQEHIRRILREDKKTKSTNKEFSKYKDSKFNSLRDYTLQDIVDNWDSISDHKNENIKTIKYFVNNPDKITDLVYDKKGLEDGYHRLIAAKILKKPRFTYRMVENLQESIRKVLREETNNNFFKGFDVSKFKNQDPPDNESEETKKEIKYLQTLKLNNKFFKEKDDILENFTDFLDEKEVKYDKKLLKKLIGDAKDIILILKEHYKRPRPFKLDKTFKDPALKSTTGYSYPSGHSTQSNLVSMVLGKMYPKYKKDFIKIAEDIMYSRQMAKAHYPSDIKFGKKLATALFNYLVDKNLIKGNLNENNDRLTSRRLLYIADEYINNLNPRDVCMYWSDGEVKDYTNEAMSEIARFTSDKIFDIKNYENNVLFNSDKWEEVYNITYDLLLELNYDNKIRDFFYESLDNCE